MKVFSSLFGSTILFVLLVNFAYAGFGITPPYVSNSSLTRNSVYEQTILLVRNDPTTDLKATVNIDVPDINSWFEIIEGNEFILPRGETKVPMTVRVTVPDDAKFQQYLGNIRIKTGPVDGDVTAGAVSISLGAQVDVNITVIDKVIKDFKVRKIGVTDLNEGHKVGWLYFPGKINFEMLIENLGNVAVSPSKVVFKIYDKTGNVLLEETRNKGRIDKIDPFNTETVYAEIPTRLPSGSYVVRFEIFNDEDVKLAGELGLNVLPYGTLQTAGFGFNGLSLPHKLSIILPILFVLLSIVLLVLRLNYFRIDSVPMTSRKKT